MLSLMIHAGYVAEKNPETCDRYHSKVETLDWIRHVYITFENVFLHGIGIEIIAN